MAKKQANAEKKKVGSNLHPPGEWDCHDLSITAENLNEVNSESLAAAWKGDKGSLDTYISNFLQFNKSGFEFLDIEIHWPKNAMKVIFLTHNRVGCIPLYSPVTGKAYANLIVRGRLGEDVGEILPLLPQPLKIDYDPKLKLPHSSAVRPPIYFECAKFIEKYLEVKRLNWQKFRSVERVQSFPTGSTNWGKYAIKSYDPKNILRYDNKINHLTTEHAEWKALKYVLKLCISELQAFTTPKATFKAYEEKIALLLTTEDLSHVETVTSLKIVNTEPLQVRELKEIGNHILVSETHEYRAWSMDFSKLYEGYVQHVSRLAAQLCRASYNFNLRYGITGDSVSWGQAYIEPDIVIQKDDTQIVIDAKYKMNMLNIHSEGASKIHEAFREDLLQVLAYSAFGRTLNKVVILAYPAKRCIVKHQQVKNSMTGIVVDLYLVGIPFGVCRDNETGNVLTIDQKTQNAKDCLTKIISQYLI